MKPLPERPSLVAQTAALLGEAIVSGEWTHWLPGEHELSRRLRVSRGTLRAALAELERQKIVQVRQGHRREVIPRRSAARRESKANHLVVLLSPLPLHQLPASNIFWTDRLREHLDLAGWPLEIHESAAVYRKRPAHALEELANRLRPATWVLYRSTPEMQHWFSRQARPGVIIGSRHPGALLPSVDKDYAACCRHAAGRFLAFGHRHLAIVRQDTRLAGDLESVSSFQDGCGVDVPVSLHDGSLRSVCASLERIVARSPRPTGIFVFEAAYMLTVLSWLQSRGLRVPRDISVLCRNDEHFLDFVVPTPSRYTLNADLFARKISRAVVEVVGGGADGARRIRLMPTFIAGGTLAEAPVQELSK